MEIAWDPNKAASNPKNHEGVTFAEAQHVFLDPFALTREDSDSENEQQVRHLGHGWKRADPDGCLHVQQRNNTDYFGLESE